MTVFGIIVLLQPTNNVLLLVSIMALQLLRESYLVFPLLTIIVSRLLHPLRMFIPMDVTLLGMVIEVNSVQSAKAMPLIISMLFEITMEVKPLQPKNAPS